ncbi:MAG: hypothetical protein Q8877_03370 [Sweet potato little leaf phytoplasma]|nr:hypothetical protein [Sweet potato little leaf phytoplasma]
MGSKRIGYGGERKFGRERAWRKEKKEIKVMVIMRGLSFGCLMVVEGWKNGWRKGWSWRGEEKKKERRMGENLDFSPFELTPAPGHAGPRSWARNSLSSHQFVHRRARFTQNFNFQLSLR